MISILVTGARGYLGGRLVLGLAGDKRFQAIGTTRGSAPPPRGWPDIELRQLDALQQEENDIAASLSGVDTVVHLAAANEIVSGRDPAGALLSGVLATVKLLRAARSAGCRRFIFLSTIHVYGAPLVGRITEANLPRPVHPYAITHRAAEDFVLAAHDKGEIEGIVLRLSNGIGAPAWPEVDRWTLVGNDFARQAVQSGKISLQSSGQQWRDFILLGDFVSAVAHVATLESGALGLGLFNLGGRLPMRILDVANLVATRAEILLGHPIPVLRPEGTEDKPQPTLDYCIDRISATGFACSSPRTLAEEIDATLRLCLAAGDALP